ncbi:MAG: PRD domain-containing protein [Clostridia bacterium]|nr:PRD domain-containing protein [Clostridia bacterium]
MRIKKVINNNILCVIDEKGHEMIITGKGIGFKRKTGERVDESIVEKVYRMEGKMEQRKLRELVEQIPLEHLKLTQDLIEYIRSQLNQNLNESLLITLADHISFAIQRQEQGIEFKNPLSGSVMCFYPTEYRLGQYCLQAIEEKCNVQLHEDEATFIALHIVNAQLNTHMSDMHDMTKLLDGCVRVTEFYYRKKFDRNSLDFSRFIVHLRYLVQRLYQNKTLEDTQDPSDIMFRELIKRNCRAHYECANRIASYIEANHDKIISDEEKIYLTIHLKRLNMPDAAD